MRADELSRGATMGSINKKQLFQQTEQVLQLIKKGWPEPHGGRKQKVFLGQDARVTLIQDGARLDLEPERRLDSVYLEDKAVDLFNQAVANIYGDDPIRSLSAVGAVENRYQTLLHSLFFSPPDERNIRVALQQMVDELRATGRHWHVLVPLVNLHIKGLDKLRIGGLTLRPTGPWLGEYYSDLLEIISKSRATKSQIGIQQVQVGSQVAALLRECPAIALVEVECDASLITNAASTRVDAVLDLLRCYGAAILAPKCRSLIGRIGESFQGTEGVLAFDQARKAFNLCFRAVGYLMPYEVTPQFLDYAKRELALNELSQILAKHPSQRTELEEQLALGISLRGDAAMARTPEQQVVHFCAALEAFVMSRTEYGDKKVPFSERLAWLLGSDYRSREEIQARALDVYKERNDVVHKGKIGVSGELVADAARLLTRALAKLAASRAQWPTRDDFVAWVEQKKLGRDNAA